MNVALYLIFRAERLIHGSSVVLPRQHITVAICPELMRTAEISAAGQTAYVVRSP
jgi:hypothetical protein